MRNSTIATPEYGQADPILHLAVTLPDPCPCGKHDALICAGAGPHKASLRCQWCNHHRGWLSHTTHTFLTQLVKKFGRPIAPIAVPCGDQRQDGGDDSVQTTE
jgi:hypothetical protein